jgi:hypothetical protein
MVTQQMMELLLARMNANTRANQEDLLARMDTNNKAMKEIMNETQGDVESESN